MIYSKAVVTFLMNQCNLYIISKFIFIIGIIGTGLLAIPVFAGNCGYALSELFGWKEGLSKKFNQAIPFYLIIIICLIIGLIINYINPISPIQMLLYAATINGIILVPIVVLIIRIANDKEILGNRVDYFLIFYDRNLLL